MASLDPPRNKVIPLEVAGVIIESYDSTLNIVEDVDQIYGKTLDGKDIIVKYKNGNYYKGEFTNGLLSGQGTFHWTDGVVYTGTFRDNKITGQGRYDFPDGSVYEGDVVIGLRHGNGRFVTAGEECVYEGEWRSGMKHGKGIMKHKNGTVYEGNFEKGLKHGYGKMVYPSGNYYEGYWARDQKEGQGTMYWVALNEKYTGSWSRNKQDGWGTHIWLEKKGDEKFLRNRYEGEWRNGLRNGFGVFYYSNGSKYEGEWVDGLKEGFAIFTYEDGRVFKGLYKNDKMIPNVSKDSVLGDIDLNTSQSRQNLQALSQVDQTAFKKQPTIAAIENSNSSRKASRKQNTNTPLMPTEKDESRELLGSEIGTNPYDSMLDINDLFGEEDEDLAADEIREVKNLLLRYHSKVKGWYRLYTGKQQVTSEESFALTSKMFWKMLRDTKVLSPKVTISSFNRLFLRGSKNTFTLHTSQEELRKELLVAKREFLDTLSESDKDTSGIKVDSPSEDEVFLNDIKTDVHDENRVLFFRHFVDALVRVSYLKYGGAPGFAKKIEKVLVKIQAAIENKKKSKAQVEEEHLLLKLRAIAEPYKEQIKALFHKFPSKEQTFVFDTIDYTMTVKDIIHLFEQCGIISDEDDKEFTLHATERVYDPEDCCIPMKKPTDDNKEKTATSREDLDRMEKLGDLLISEVVFLEFYDILLLSLFHRDGATLKEEEARRRLTDLMSAIESYVKDSTEERKDLSELEPDINWPYSDKDYMSEHLATEKEKREMMLAALKQKKLEREHEEKETRAMEKEDFDIGDEYLKRPQTKQSYESGEYMESYNDF